MKEIRNLHRPQVMCEGRIDGRQVRTGLRAGKCVPRGAVCSGSNDEKGKKGRKGWVGERFRCSGISLGRLWCCSALFAVHGDGRQGREEVGCALGGCGVRQSCPLCNILRSVSCVLFKPKRVRVCMPRKGAERSWWLRVRCRLRSIERQRCSLETDAPCRDETRCDEVGRLGSARSM